ncbi:MAG: Trimethylamine corrinoid protein MtbC1 [Candidatus Methanohalarchaeum thermophilum]|uniref:Trimethylamine corrinoid protein MtbC1 n=1 Tax=Methanohalarchaeum thermophilum TaxID=1903181 RepID=A0A1Q6DXL9_METT1|nr:MAG: Trimethylamine corrinoid protein MtbC1 [Candidatus Methanohalarchaeum thermophilum]
MAKQEILDGLKDAIVNMDEDKARDLSEEALDEGIGAFEAITEGLARGMKVVSDKFDKAEVYLPQVMKSADAMQAAMEVLRPELQEGEETGKGKVVIGTVEGDIHEIGKNVVVAMLQGSGFDVIDLGRDIALKEFVERAEEEKADIVAASALMSTTKPGQKKIVELIQEKGLDLKTMFGGAPVTEEWVEEIGGDGYAPNAAEATGLAESLL